MLTKRQSNQLTELIINLHIHTSYSDGSALHADVAKAAIDSNLDAIIITDHNILVEGKDGYYQAGSKKTLLIVGEEIHDQGREPQKNHLLVIGAGRELSTYADNPQKLINQVCKTGGLSFIAHPVDPELLAFNEEDISWENWDVHGFTGLELWNGFSELKTIVKSKAGALLYAYFPEFIPHGPIPATLKRWDGLIAGGDRIVAVGGSDSHARQMSMGPLRRVIFPYTYHFSTINTHLLVSKPLSGDAVEDRKEILSALTAGHGFIGYDLPALTRGFRFSAAGKNHQAIMGDEIIGGIPITLQVRLPRRAECQLICDGEVIKKVNGEALTHLVTEPGVYRVEAFMPYLGKRRGWIFSNPIYIRS